MLSGTFKFVRGSTRNQADERFQFFHFSLCANSDGTVKVNRTVKVVPELVLSAMIFPLCRSITWRAIAKDNPWPSEW